ncbi:hypothetical protein NLX78_07665 [Paenibacillus sp. Lou8.1]|uniref:Kelch repeat-containing protein n=1 Tax=Paenibacillus sp. Lou8.1 TaxID=2962041 RepID=UPI0020B6A052|nr:kelch repeat-containing protein [Paenibacillus sp. Lou8.1]MCP3807108.1 hypothetical protein [Paenibacillus sp. Lou8.1]
MKRKTYLLVIFSLVFGFVFQTSLASAAENTEWETRSSLTEARAGAASAEVNGVIYIFGGSAQGDQAVTGEKKNTTFGYNSQTDTWSRKADMPTIRSAASAVAVGDKIYVIGGYYGPNSLRTNKVEIYDTKTNTWTTAANMLEARSWAASVLMDNNIYVIDGANNSDIVPTVEKYNISTDTWVKLKNFPVALNAMSAVALNGKIYAFGGSKYFTSEISNSIYEYNVDTDTWTKKNNLLTASNVSATAVYNGEVYIMGGLGEGAMVSRVEVYNPITNKSRLITKLTSNRGQSSGAFVNGKLYIIGGTSNGRILDTVESYTLADPEPQEPVTPTEPNPIEPTTPTGERAILVVTMDTGLDKEFDLSMKEVNDFIAWYEAKQAGSGTASYAINKHKNNIGPFSSRNYYVIFNKILTFEVSEYSTK